MQLVYKHLEEQAAADDSGETDLAAEEEALLHGGNQDYPQQLTHAVDNLHESSVISICCWPGDNSRAVTGSGNFVASRQQPCYIAFKSILTYTACL